MVFGACSGSSVTVNEPQLVSKVSVYVFDASSSADGASAGSGSRASGASTSAHSVTIGRVAAGAR